MTDGLAGWEGMDAPHRADLRDFFAAGFRPLAELDTQLAGQLAQRFVRRLLRQAGLSEHRYREALDSLVLTVGTTPLGKLLLQVDLPFVGPMTIEWDGTVKDAEDIVDTVADTKAGTIELDREVAGPTGWEPDFD